MRTLLSLWLVCVPAFALDQRAQAGAAAITEVVQMLEKMLAKSKEDGSSDRDAYAKFKCYCDTTTEARETAISEATTDITAKDATLESKRTENTKLSQEVAKLKKSMEKNEAARTEATTIRDEEKEAFAKESEDLDTGIGQLGRAVEMLSAIGADQTSTADADSARLSGGFMVKKSELKKLSGDMKQALNAASVFLSGKQRKSLTSFLEAPGNYNSQSTAIVGVLQSMKDTFEKNLENAKKAEEKGQKEYDTFTETKTQEYEDMEQEHQDKKDLIGDNSAEIATLMSSIDTLKGEVETDTEFLASLRNRCATKKAESEKRNMLRANEEAAVAQAIAILNSDAAFETFGKTKAASFVQTSVVKDVSSVAQSLMAKARSTHSMRLARVASAMGKNPFEKVLSMIEEVISTIDKEAEADLEKKDWCKKEQDDGNASVDEKTNTINSLTDQINSLDDSVSALKDSISTAQSDLQMNRDSQKQETSTRKDAHKAFQSNLSDLQAAESLLTKAIEVLTKYYDHLADNAHGTGGESALITFERHMAKDSGGGNLKLLSGKSVAQLRTACEQDSSCVGFNSAGWLKSKLSTTSDWYDWEGGDLYVKQSTQLALTQQDPSEGDDPFSGNTEGQSGEGNKAIEMLDFILKDTKSEQSTAINDESTSQTQYEEQMQTLTRQEQELQDSIAAYKKDLADQEKQIEEAHEDKTTTTKEKMATERYLADIEPGCTFIQKNFDKRETNRGKEKTALTDVVAQLKATPAFQNAVAMAERQALGRCADTCETEGLGHAKCEACKNDVTVAGWCVQHDGSPGC